MLLIDRDVLEIAHSLRQLQEATGLESLQAIAADGAVYSASGQLDRVNPPPELEARYADIGAEIVYHHSHPDERALSPSDLDLIAQTGVKTIWAHAPSGASYGARLREGIAKDRYRTALDELRSYLLPEIVRSGGASLDDRLFEDFRDFATMLVLEERGWIDCHLAWSDRTRRSIFKEMKGFFALLVYLTGVTPAA
jgi:hypothetical protein